jgi:hypothetical protein
MMAGGRALAAALRAIAPLSAIKAADETVSTGVGTLQNDDALFIPVEANSVYMFVVLLGYQGGTAGSSDLKTGWSLPSGATMAWTDLKLNTSSAVVVSDYDTEATTPVLQTTAGNRFGTLIGTLTTSAAGMFQFQWCPNSANVATIVRAGSALVAWKLN